MYGYQLKLDSEVLRVNRILHAWGDRIVKDALEQLPIKGSGEWGMGGEVFLSYISDRYCTATGGNILQLKYKPLKYQ